MVESLEARIRRVTQEPIAIVPYDPVWPEQFVQEKAHLLTCLPADVVRRIEHFGSTAVPGLAAKPVIDMLVEVSSLEVVKTRVVPVLEAQGYEYFWRPTHGEDGGPFYAWFIKRDASGVRTHHVHMVESGFTAHWDRLLFRDYLVRHTDVAREYEALKYGLAAAFPNDRVAYTRAKAAFINRVTAQARAGMMSETLNDRVLRWLREQAGTKSDQAAVSSPDDPNNYWDSGAHPDVVERLWDQLGSDLPIQCRVLVFGRAALVHPASGTILAFSLGTEYAIRLPRELWTDRRPADLRTVARWTGGGSTDIEQECGRGWIFGSFAPEEATWCKQVFRECSLHPG